MSLPVSQAISALRQRMLENMTMRGLGKRPRGRTLPSPLSIKLVS